MTRQKTKLLILCVCVCKLITAQQVSFIRYSVYDGLVANPVRCIYQDSKGFIWIGTYDGLSRYDGHRFTNYTNTNGLSHNLINSIFEVNGKLLIAENNGAIDVIQNNIVKKSFMAGSAVNKILPYRDRVLLPSDANGIYEYKNDTFILPGQDKTNIPLGHFLPTSDSLLLVAGVDHSIMIYRKDLSIHSSSKYTGIVFYTLFRDSKKRLWACTSHGLKPIEIDPTKERSVSLNTLPGEFNFPPLNNAPVTSMVEEKDGGFWIGTLKGLVRLFPDGNYYVYNEKDGLPASMINTLYRDKENNLWIGTALGLAKWVSKNSVVFYNTEHKEFKNDINWLFPVKDNQFLLTTEHGLQHFYGDSKLFRDIKVDLKSYPIPIQGSPFLVYSAGSIGIIDSTKNAIKPLKKLDTSVTGANFISQHPDGTIFVGTFNGVYALRQTAVKMILPHRVTSLIIDKDDNTWIGTWTNGLFRVVIKNSEEMIYDVRDVTASFGQAQVRGLYADSEKNIWVGTRYTGAFRLTPGSNNSLTVQHFNRQKGLMSDWVSSFAEAGNGDMWVGGYLGLDKLIREPTGYRVFNFSKVVNFFAEIKNIVSARENEWICVANKGIAFFTDEKLHQSPPLAATILSTTLGTGENKLNILLPTEKVSLKTYQNAARFEFSALGFVNERQLLYSYRLKGSSDTSWSKPENIHEATYASLSPGHYTFEVKTFGWNGEYGPPAVFSFHISTPFWKQWWFIALCFLAVIIVFYGLYRYRIRQLLKLQQVRNSIATDLHDDIGSSLTNISILSELSSKHLSQPEKAEPFLQRISQEVQSSSQAMDDIIWSVNSRNDSLQEVMARMRRYAAELFDTSETNCHLQLDENSGNKRLTMEQRRDVYLIYKEALTNIHKHAKAKNVWITVTQSQNHLSMQIKDDGTGFTTSTVTHRNGLKNLQSRVEKWNGKIQIRSENNKGTFIDIKIPLKD